MKLSIYTLVQIFILTSHTISSQSVNANIDVASRTATMSNESISISINSKAHVSSLKFNGKELVSNGGRFYFSYNDQSSYSELSPNAIRIENQSDDYAEVVYSRTSGDLLLEQAFIMRKGINGLYMYVTVKGTSKMIRLREMRVVYRVDPFQFDYGYVTERMQGYLPSVDVMKAVDGDAIMDATYPLPDGSIYTKYDWANYIVQDSVHGLMSDTHGVWAIPVSTEYMNGGPMKQELTVHTTTKTPLVLQMLQGEHFGAAAQEFSTGDEKIYGPFFIYCNSGDSHESMISDAQLQASVQKAQWPFQWLDHELYPVERTNVNGRFKVPWGVSAKDIMVVLAQEGSDIYDQGKAYIFWDKTDASGNYNIKHVRPGEYAMYAYATSGDVSDTYFLPILRLKGEEVNLPVLNWHTDKRKNLLWSIGENNRLSDGYFLSGHLREYGLYELPPANLSFNPETDDPAKDWYYAQTKEGTWTIRFNLDESYNGNAYLTASIAGAANSPKVDVYVNNAKKDTWSFSNDASIYRSAVLSGRHNVKKISFPASDLVQGQNTVKLTMTDVGNRGGVMYDLIKLETGKLITAIDNNISEQTQLNTYPNPFTKTVHIEFNSQGIMALNIAIFDIHGKLIESIYEGQSQQGLNHFEWSPEDFSSGTYFCKLNTKQNALTKKIILIK